MPLPTVTLGTNGIQTTPLGFGCAGLFRTSSPTGRSNLLHAAYDAGVRHFDVAPMYGLGRAEAELGAFTRARRAEITIATKFGIQPTRAARYLSYAQRPARRLFEARPGIRDQAKAQAASSHRLIYEKRDYNALGAKRSLERSLRALDTDYIDAFLLHDPFPGSVRSDEVASYMERACSAGLIRSWGIAGEPGPADEVAQSFCRDVPIRQLRDDIFLRSLESSPPGPAFITYGIISQALTRLVQHLNTDDSTRSRWKTMIGSDCGDPDVAASFLLQAAFKANSSGIVLFSTSRPSRIQAAVAAHEKLSSLNEAGLDSFMHMVNLELTPVSQA